MKKVILIFISLCISDLLYSQSLQPNDSIKQFVDYLTSGNHLSPKEYIFQSFEKNDIIILSERNHKEIKQYELIVDIIKDDRFKGNIYTEVGVFNSQK